MASNCDELGAAELAWQSLFCTFWPYGLNGDFQMGMPVLPSFHPEFYSGNRSGGGLIQIQHSTALEASLKFPTDFIVIGCEVPAFVDPELTILATNLGELASALVIVATKLPHLDVVVLHGLDQIIERPLDWHQIKKEKKQSNGKPLKDNFSKFNHLMQRPVKQVLDVIFSFTLNKAHSQQQFLSTECVLSIYQI